MQELSALHPFRCPALITEALHSLRVAGAVLQCHGLEAQHAECVLGQGLLLDCVTAGNTETKVG